jgi:aminocarboxymuconate-semialdehyde decarboxylase
MTRTIDVHSHFYPEVYIREIARASSVAEVIERDGETHIAYAGDYSVIVPAHRDPQVRIAEMDRAGVDMQLLSLTVPGVHLEAPERGRDLARLVNDSFAEIVATYPERFGAFATLPVQDPAAAARELERAVRELGLCGAMLFTNIDGVSLADQRFWPIFEAAEALSAPLLIHPVAPASLDNMADLRLVALLGFPFEMTLIAARLVLGGVFDRFPRLIVILAQLGGALPMLAERIERGYAIYPELTGALQRPPSDYFRTMYYDTVPYGATGIPLTHAFAGPERILLGSDYPHQIGDLPGATAVIEAMQIPDTDKVAMRGGNAARLLRGLRE